MLFLQTKNADNEKINNNPTNFTDANKKFHKNIGQSELHIDILLAKVIFILDIYDEDTVATVLNQLTKFDEKMLAKYNNLQEYAVRPISATVALNEISSKDEGDCVETLYRHLINIAIQDPDHSRRNRFHIERLPVELRKYYDPNDKYYNEIKANIETPKGFVLSSSEAGVTDIKRHHEWKQCLTHSLKSLLSSNINITSDFYNEIILSKENLNFCVSIGSTNYIANILHGIAFYNSKDNNITAGLNDENKKNAMLIENAMNKLAALSAKNEVRFHVYIEDANCLKWADKKMQIDDFHAKRKITIGIQNNGHAEIINIEALH